MIARLAMNPASLVELGGAADAPADVFAQHSQLCAMLETHGLLVVGSHDEGQALVAAVVQIERRSHEAGLIWRDLFKLLRNNRRVVPRRPACSCSLQDVDSLATLRTQWKQSADVIVLTDDQADRVGVKPTEVSRIDTTGLDLVPARRAFHAQTLQHLRDLRENGFVDNGTPRQRFWEQVLRPIATVSNEIVIYDRYLYGRLAQRRRDAPASDAREPEHVVWLLEQLDGLSRATGLHVQLLGSFNSRPGSGEEGRAPTNGEDAGELVRNYWTPSGGGIAQLDVVAVNFTTSLPHARHLRSDIGVGITMEAGWDRFSRSNITESGGVEWAYRWKSQPIKKFRDAEQRVMRDASVRTTTIHPA